MHCRVRVLWVVYVLQCAHWRARAHLSLVRVLFMASDATSDGGDDDWYNTWRRMLCSRTVQSRLAEQAEWMWRMRLLSGGRSWACIFAPLAIIYLLLGRNSHQQFKSRISRSLSLSLYLSVVLHLLELLLFCWRRQRWPLMLLLCSRLFFFSFGLSHSACREMLFKHEINNAFIQRGTTTIFTWQI